MDNSVLNLNEKKKPRPSKSAAWSLAISILALLISLVGGYLAFNAAYLSYQTRAEIEAAVKQAQTNLESLKSAASANAPAPAAPNP